jgi:hypothetical protein
MNESSRVRIAYFSMEIAANPNFLTYAGGLGVLAGDTLRSAADLGLPLSTALPCTTGNSRTRCFPITQSTPSPTARTPCLGPRTRFKNCVGWHSTSGNEEALVILHGKGTANIESQADVRLQEKMRGLCELLDI